MSKFARGAGVLVFLWAVGCTSAESSPGEFLNLRGSWKMNFADEPGFKNADFNDENWSEVSLPSNWKGLEDADIIAWYRKQFTIPPGTDTGVLALTFIAHDADEAFVNGNWIGGSASIQDKSVHAYGQIRVYPIPSEFLRGGSNVIAIRVRGLIPQNSGITQGRLGIGSVDALEKHRAAIEVRQFSFAAAYIVTGLYFFILFLRVPALRTHLSFSLFCLFLGSYLFLRIAAAQDTLGFQFAKRLEYLLLFCMPVFFCAFAHDFLRLRLWMSLPFVFVFGAFLIVPVIFDTPVKWNGILAFWHPMVSLFSLIVISFMIRRAVQGSREARIMLSGTIIFFVTILNDALDDRAMISTIRMSEYGFLAFVVSMSASLVQTFVGLQRQQAETVAQLTAMDHLKERLLTNVTNILNEPAAAIAANVRRLREAGGEDTSIAAELVDQGQKMNDALDGVLLLSRLQSGVEGASTRLMNALDLKEMAPQIDWTAETSVRASPGALGALFRMVDSKGGRMGSTNAGGIRIEFPAAEAGRHGELEDAIVMEAVRVLGGRMAPGPSSLRVIEIPNGAESTPIP